MKYGKAITILVICIVIFAGLATTVGIFSHQGSGSFEYQSIRGRTVLIYGKGLYQHMSAQVAPQGIAQDVITLGIGIPLLLMAFFLAVRGSLRGRFLFTGTLGYFLVTYLFYSVMGMYNIMFLGYVILLSCSFYAFVLSLADFEVKGLPQHFQPATPTRFAGGFLILNSIAIALMWLSIVVTPLLNGAIFPVELEHYTTLIVQGLDLAILLPLSFLSGWLFLRRRPAGYLLAPVYLVFLTLLMTALTAKVIAMAMIGANVIPAIILIPLFNLTALWCTIRIFKNLNTR